MLIFISYRSVDRTLVETLAGDLHALGHTIWFDQELTGGHAWWNSILESVRRCDLFIFALTPASLDSYPCQLEYRYADALQKPILPVLLKAINANLLPPELSKIQFVDYKAQDKKASISLARALALLPPPLPLPDPLPATPEAPISGLGRLKERIETSARLSPDEQAALVLELKVFYQESDTQTTADELLRRLQNRPDLFANIDREIKDILASKSPLRKSSFTKSEPLKSTLPQASKLSVLRSVVWPYLCAALGAIVLSAPMHALIYPPSDESNRNLIIGALISALGLLLSRVLPSWLKTRFHRRLYGLHIIVALAVGLALASYTAYYTGLSTAYVQGYIAAVILVLGFVIGAAWLANRPRLQIGLGAAGALGFYIALLALLPENWSFPLATPASNTLWLAAHFYATEYAISTWVMLLAAALACSVLVHWPQLGQRLSPAAEQ